MLAGCELPPPRAALLPDEWVDDYDYSSDFAGYLREKYRIARSRSRTAYAYFYGDWCPPCKVLRRRMGEPEMKAAFDGTLIIMLDVYRFNHMSGRPESLRVPGVPLFAKIAPEGYLTTDVAGMEWGDPLPRDLPNELAGFFRENNEP